MSSTVVSVRLSHIECSLWLCRINCRTRLLSASPRQQSSSSHCQPVCTNGLDPPRANLILLVPTSPRKLPAPYLARQSAPTAHAPIPIALDSAAFEKPAR
jgi:hypothetical protein